MCSSVVWCYILVLSLVDLGPISRLSAQGKDHGKIDFVEATPNGHNEKESFSFPADWPEQPSEAADVEAESEALARGIRLTPPHLNYKTRELGTAHKAKVTLTNTGPDVLKLVSISGNTPDFHASFYEHKHLPVGHNTSFDVVLVGLRCGPSEGALELSTKRGLLRYRVSAFNSPPSSGLWPLSNIMLPPNITLSEPLVLHNPLDRDVQVTEMHSSASAVTIDVAKVVGQPPPPRWLVKAGGARAVALVNYTAPTTNAWVRLKLRGRDHHTVVPRQVKAAPPGAYISPLQIRVYAAGVNDPPLTHTISLGNSAEEPLDVNVGVVSRCRATPHEPPLTEQQPPLGDSSGGVTLAALRPTLQRHQWLTPAARVTFHFAEMWSSFLTEPDSRYNETLREDEAWCAGWAHVAGRSLPFSVRLIQGGATVTPETLHLTQQSGQLYTLRVQNNFLRPLQLLSVEYGPRLTDCFEMSKLELGVVCVGCSRAFLRLQVTGKPPLGGLDSWIRLNTGITSHTIPVSLYNRNLSLVWDWPTATAHSLPLGLLTLASTTRVTATLTHAAPAPLCIKQLDSELAEGNFELPGCDLTKDLPCRCISGGSSLQVALTVSAGEGGGGAVTVVTDDDDTVHVAVTYSVDTGGVTVRPVRGYGVAPYCPQTAAIVLDNSTPRQQRLRSVTLYDGERPAPIQLQLTTTTINIGSSSVGTVTFNLDQTCVPHCYTGLTYLGNEAQQWDARAQKLGKNIHHADDVITEDLKLLKTKRCLFDKEEVNVTMQVQTSEVVSIQGWAHATLAWPRLVAGDATFDGIQCGVGARAPLKINVYNPSELPLLLQPVVATRQHMENGTGSTFSPWCDPPNRCIDAPSAFVLSGWMLLKGRGGGLMRVGGSTDAPLLLLQPGATVQITITFRPLEERSLAAALYLRNNLTVLEGVALAGRGSIPALTLNNRPPLQQPLLFEVLECGTPPSGGVSRRVVTARNAGAAPLRLTGWAIAGAPCRARGFTVHPCTETTLPPNGTHTLTITFAADYSLSLVTANLTVNTDGMRLTFELRARVPTKVIEECIKSAPRPSWERHIRNLGAVVAALAVALVVTAGALDAERLLRRRTPQRPPRPPLDLRNVTPPSPPLQPIQQVAVKQANKRKKRKADPAAEAKAFDAWRASLRPRPAPAPQPPHDQHRDSEEELSDTNDQDDNDQGNDGDREDDNDRDDDQRHSPPPSEPEDDKLPIEMTEQDYEINDLDDLGDIECDLLLPPRPETPPPPYEAVAGIPVTSPRANTPRRRRPPARRGTRPRRHNGTPPATVLQPVNTVTPPAQHGVHRDTGNTPTNSGSVRWGTSWSSVVVGAPPPVPPRPAPIAPPRPAPQPPADHSLFYFNQPAYFEPAVTKPNTATANGDNDFGEPVPPRPVYPWRGAAGGDWSWLPPPPGLAPPPAAPRAYDPFQSLAQVWLDWRDDDVHRQQHHQHQQHQQQYQHQQPPQ